MIGPFAPSSACRMYGCCRGSAGMQPVPALDAQRLAAQFVVAGHAPDIGRHLVLLRQDLLRPQRLVQDRAAAEQLHRGLALLGRLGTVDALEDAFCRRPRGIGGCT